MSITTKNEEIPIVYHFKSYFFLKKRENSREKSEKMKLTSKFCVKQRILIINSLVGEEWKYDKKSMVSSRRRFIINVAHY